MGAILATPSADMSEEEARLNGWDRLDSKLSYEELNGCLTAVQGQASPGSLVPGLQIVQVRGRACWRGPVSTLPYLAVARVYVVMFARALQQTLKLHRPQAATAPGHPARCSSDGEIWPCRTGVAITSELRTLAPLLDEVARQAPEGAA